MGEILLAFSIILLTIIVFYIHREKTKKINTTSNNINKHNILNTPTNNRNKNLLNMNENSNFNGQNNFQNLQSNLMNSPFNLSNPNYIKIKNINYNSISHVSPINNYSLNKNDNFVNSYNNCASDHNNFQPNNFGSLNKDNIENFDRKIKNINLISNDNSNNKEILNKENSIIYTNANKSSFQNEYLSKLNNNCNDFKDKNWIDDYTYFKNNTEKKSIISNSIFKREVDFETSQKNYLNSERKDKVYINSLSDNICYEGIKKLTDKKKKLEKENPTNLSFDQVDCKESYQQGEKIEDNSPKNFNKVNQNNNYDYEKVKKRLSFNSMNNEEECFLNNKNYIDEDNLDISELNQILTKKKDSIKILEKEIQELEKTINTPLNKGINIIKKPPLEEINLNSNVKKNSKTNINYLNESEKVNKNFENSPQNIEKLNKINNSYKKNNYSILVKAKEKAEKNVSIKSETNNIITNSNKKKLDNIMNIYIANKENNKNISNVEKNENSLLEDLVPKIKNKKNGESINSKQSESNKNKNYYLSSIREVEKSNENNTSDKNYKNYDDSAQNLSFASDNVQCKRMIPVQTSNFNLNSPMKEI